MTTVLDELIRHRIEQGRATAADFRGCSDAEVANLESAVELSLPTLFKDYLRLMGKSAGEMLCGSDIRFGCLHLLTGEGREEMAGRGVTLPPDAFVFFAHQGYDYMYFFTSDGAGDPPVHRYHSDWEDPRQVFPAFSGYLRWMFATSSEIPPGSLEDNQM